MRVVTQKSQPFCDTISIDNASFPAIVTSWGVLQREVLKQQGHHWGVKCVAFSPGSVTLKRGKAGGQGRVCSAEVVEWVMLKIFLWVYMTLTTFHKCSMRNCSLFYVKGPLLIFNLYF